jgi:hypothetical protein
MHDNFTIFKGTSEIQRMIIGWAVTTGVGNAASGFHAGRSREAACPQKIMVAFRMALTLPSGFCRQAGDEDR